MSFSNCTQPRSVIIVAAIGTSMAGLISVGRHWYGAIAYATPLGKAEL